ncbi:MAG TPA: MerR family transcriptional regulator [Polyangiaceae bacterium]|nr:MerR family transcriptional regulator [Polyangiaceae bacterium]
MRSPRAEGPNAAGLPAKLYFRIGEVAELIGVEPHVLRYWEREFRTIRPTKSRRGQRVYSRRDVETLARIRALLYDEGFTIAGAKRKLAAGAASHDGASDADDDRMEDGGVSHDERLETAARPTTAAASTTADAPTLATVATAPERTRATESEIAPQRAAMPRLARERLVALRDEIEAFLAELEPTP